MRKFFALVEKNTSGQDVIDGKFLTIGEQTKLGSWMEKRWKCRIPGPFNDVSSSVLENALLNELFSNQFIY